jgi:biotin carboxyl carrier protein
MKINVKIANQSFEVEIDDLQSRPILAKVDGQTFEIWPEEAAAPAAPAEPAVAPSAPAARPAPAAASAPRGAAPVMEPANASTALLSPLPGTVIAIIVREGDEVKVGQELLTLEAMKMKNAIRANRDGKIAAIRVNVGDQVRHNQVLLEYAS